MILKVPYTKGLVDYLGTDYRYYGKDAEEFLKSIGWEHDIKFLGKECKHGIIIGIEDSNSCADYYYIVYDPKTDKISYQLANNNEFFNSITL